MMPKARLTFKFFMHMNYQQVIHGLNALNLLFFSTALKLRSDVHINRYFLLTGMVSKSARKMSETRISTLQVYASINGRATFIYYNQQWNF